jgi:hypothetical protein
LLLVLIEFLRGEVHGSWKHSPTRQTYPNTHTHTDTHTHTCRPTYSTWICYFFDPEWLIQIIKTTN